MADANNTIVLAGTAAADEPLSPVVGARPCSITRPLFAPPSTRGRFGRAWRVNLGAARKKLPHGTPPDAVVAHWVVEAPWSSEVVHSYSLILTHLRFTLHHRPVVHYLEGATHELALIAIHPEADRAPMLTEPTDPRVWLQPPVFAAQIAATSDEIAAARAAHAIDLVCEGRLSPHPTHARSWAQLFGDNMLRHAAQEERR